MEKRQVITVRYLKADDKLSRPHKIQKITNDKEEIKYFNMNRSNTVDPSTKRIDPSVFITEWERAGRTPTQNPLRKYCDESLKKMGCSIEEIRTIRERNFSAKDVKLVCNKLKIKSAEARELLEKHDGKKHLLYKTILGDNYNKPKQKDPTCKIHNEKKDGQGRCRFCNRKKNKGTRNKKR